MNQDKSTIDLLKQALLAAFALILFYAATSCNAYAAMYQQPTQGAPATDAPAVIQLPVTQTVKPTPSRAPLLCTVTTGYQMGALNMRTGPGIRHAVIQTLLEGEPLTVIDRGAWPKVRTAQGVTGWVNNRYCKIGE